MPFLCCHLTVHYPIRSSVVLETKRVYQSTCSLATDPASPGVLMRWELFQIAYRLL